MKYALCFQSTTCGYRLHSLKCSQAINDPRNGRFLIDELFDSVETARAWANDDESGKAGREVKADFKICNCTKEKSK